METILASIRRIISEEEPAATAAPTPAPTRIAAEDDDALVELDENMIVQSAPQPPVPQPPAPAQQPAPPPSSDAAPVAMPDVDQPLLASEARLAAARSIDSLHEALQPPPVPQHGLPVFRSGGPSLEDLVRDELRGQLKLWLDANLPEMVERLVRAEIERVVRRN